MNQKPGLLTRLVVSSLAVFVADWLLPGVTIDSFSTAIGVAIVLGILNATLKPLLIIINAIIIGVADQWVDGMHVSSTWTAILFSFLISTISSWMYKWGEGR
ncbi:MAG: phage holin family protein [Schleiferiaceae bacterium]